MVLDGSRSMAGQSGRPSRVKASVSYIGILTAFGKPSGFVLTN
jgi:hypothetical protein